MTLHQLAITTAMASVTAIAAQADSVNPDKPDPTGTVDVPEAEVNVPEAMMSDDGEVTAPRTVPMQDTQLDQADKTAIDNVLRAVENGATINSVDDLTIGETVSHDGERGARHLVYVDVAGDADLAADRIAFEVSSLSVERDGALEYDYTLEQLREAVAARVAAMAE